MRALIASVVTASVIGWLGSAAASDVSTAKTAEALSLCESVDLLPATDKATKLERLDRGVQLGEEAVAADDSDARAHFAIVCNLGKRLDVGGVSWRVFGLIRRMRAEIDRAHQLAPDDPDILVCKGEMMRRLPGPLGGDKQAGMILLRRAIEIRPDHVPARLYLARAKAEAHAPDARASVYEVLAIAKKSGAVREQAEAEDLLASLRD